MSYKLLGKLFTASGVISTVNNNNLLKSIPSICQKARCHLKSENENSEERVKKLLDDSSPLKSVNDDLWATQPYPEGTVFKGSKKKEVEPRPAELTKSVIMFPGQGNQFVGMAKDLLEYTVVREMFDTASEILKVDLLKVCLEGPESKLNRTEYCQPATFVCSLGALEKLKHEKPWTISNCAATCGYSLGEITSLVFAGVIRFEEGVKLIKVRSKAMELCCRRSPGGMMSVLHGSNSSLGKAFEDAIAHCVSLGIPNPVCGIAVHLFPLCKVIAGNIEALNYLIENSEKYEFRKLSKLAVSGAFHTDLMKDAAEPVKKVLETVKINEPLVDVYSNVSGRKFSNVKAIRHQLPEQIYKPVKWEQVLNRIFNSENESPYPYCYECGPGASLTLTLRKINRAAATHCYSVKV